jgi:uncharacterized Zn finger protein
VITDDGDLLATVVGGDRYAVTVALNPGGRGKGLKSTCTCPVGSDGCKHAVAVVADYIQAVADKREVPVASVDDPRWAKLASRGAERAEWDDEWGEDDESWDDDESWEDDAVVPAVKKSRAPKKTAPRAKAPVNWNEKIEQDIRAKPQKELADLVWSLTQRFPEVYQEFRERIALREGDVDRLVAEARREIRQVTSETG